MFAEGLFQYLAHWQYLFCLDSHLPGRMRAEWPIEERRLSFDVRIRRGRYVGSSAYAVVSGKV